jgi:hypothetical protein
VSRNAWIVRERFRETTCPTIYAKYVESNFPKESDTPEKLSLLKADLSRVLDVLHWYYSLIPMRERIRKALTVQCIRYVVFYSVVLGAILVACHHYSAHFLAMVACVTYSGIIGGFVSSQRRMQSLPADGDPLVSVFGLDNANYYLWLSPLLGAIFAIIVAFMFIAGILKGSVFPAFYSPADPHGLSFFTFTWVTIPTSSEEYGKLFVWAFLAGFAERLVPDSLDRLSSKLDPNEAKGSSPPSPPPAPGAPPYPSPEPELDDEAPKQEIAPEVLQNVMHTGEAPKEPAAKDDGDQKSE